MVYYILHKNAGNFAESYAHYVRKTAISITKAKTNLIRLTFPNLSHWIKACASEKTAVPEKYVVAVDEAVAAAATAAAAAAEASVSGSEEASAAAPLAVPLLAGAAGSLLARRSEKHSLPAREWPDFQTEVGAQIEAEIEPLVEAEVPFPRWAKEGAPSRLGLFVGQEFSSYPCRHVYSTTQNIHVSIRRQVGLRQLTGRFWGWESLVL